MLKHVKIYIYIEEFKDANVYKYQKNIPRLAEHLTGYLKYSQLFLTCNNIIITRIRLID